MFDGSSMDKKKSFVGKTYFYVFKKRSRQGSNLRPQRGSDFKSDALTTRPRLLYVGPRIPGLIQIEHIEAGVPTSFQTMTDGS